MARLSHVRSNTLFAAFAIYVVGFVASLVIFGAQASFGDLSMMGVIDPFTKASLWPIYLLKDVYWNR